MPGVAKLLIGTVAQGSADAFAEAEIVTGLANTPNTAFQVTDVVLQLAPVIGADSSSEAAISRKSFAAMPTYADRAVICYEKQICELTTSGMDVYSPNVHFKWAPDEDMLVVEDPLYLEIDTNGTSATNTARCRIMYKSVRISEVDRLALIASSLAS